MAHSPEKKPTIAGGVLPEDRDGLRRWLFEYLWFAVRYWAREPLDGTIEGRLEGFLLMVLSVFDGQTMLPRFTLTVGDTNLGSHFRDGFHRTQRAFQQRKGLSGAIVPIRKNKDLDTERLTFALDKAGLLLLRIANGDLTGIAQAGIAAEVIGELLRSCNRCPSWGL